MKRGTPCPRARHLAGAAARRAAGGFTLIEVLVSLLVFSMGVLGTIGMQAQSTRFSVQASERGRAALLANDLVATMWAAQTTSLSDTQIAAWQARLEDDSAGLPDADYQISEPAEADGTVTITIGWTSVARGSAGAPGQYVTQLAMPDAEE